MSLESDAKPTNMEDIVQNYEKLFEEENVCVSIDSHILDNGHISVKHHFASPAATSKTLPWSKLRIIKTLDRYKKHDS